MNKKSWVFFALIACCGSSLAQADNSSRNQSPIDLAKVTACAPVQDCVSNGQAALVESCCAATPACVSDNHNRDSVTPELLAQRAIAARGCSTKQFTLRGPCNACFRGAGAMLSERYNFALFQGLLGYARGIVLKTQHDTCDALPTRRSTDSRNSGGEHRS